MLRDQVRCLLSKYTRLQTELTASNTSRRRLESYVAMLDGRVHELIVERDALKAELPKAVPLREIASKAGPKRGAIGRFEKRIRPGLPADFNPNRVA